MKTDLWNPAARMCEVISHLYLLNMSNMQDPCYTQWVDLREKFQSISSQSVQFINGIQWPFQGKYQYGRQYAIQIERDNSELIMVFISYGSSGYMWPFQEPIYWRYLPY